MLCSGSHYTMCVLTGLSRNGWTMETPDTVTGRLGSPVTVYCKFTPPHPRYTGNITIMWKAGRTGPVYIKYTNYRPDSQGKYQNVIDVNEGERYRVIGNPRRNDATIKINQLRGEDNNKLWSCRVELQGGDGKFETDPGARLIVTGEERWEVGMRRDVPHWGRSQWEVSRPRTGNREPVFPVMDGV
eukprot:gi/632992307/ref/XP_007885025.1/ PREDICTED: sialic acid-binding Ig-like lectin 15 [Callorhinchus milii]